MPLSIAHGLLGATIVAAVRDDVRSVRDWRPLVAGATIAAAPDLDHLFLVFGVRGMHRTFTHSLVTALAVGVVCLIALGRERVREVSAYTLALASHGVLDSLATKAGGGVELLWPLSFERYKLGFVGFSDFAGGYTLAGLVKWSIAETVVFTPIFAAVLLWRFRRSEAKAAA